MEKCIFL